MTLTFKSGHWANDSETCAIVETEERGAVAISAERPDLWEALDTAVKSGAITLSPMPVNLAELKASLKRKVDADAEAKRLQYLTPGVGMAMTYDEKHTQARAVHGLGEQAANALTEQERVDQFPTLSASVGIEAPTLWACADLVIQRYEAFATLSHGIERTRLAGKAAIAAATTAAGARTACEAITW